VNHLLRSLAPISDAGWKLLDEEATQRLTAALAARRLVDFSGPHGWDYSATPLGRADELAGAPVDGVRAHRRRVLPLVELRAGFDVARAELRAADRGAADADLESLDAAAQRIARAENTAVCHGFEAAGIAGITQAASHPTIELGDDFDEYPRHAATAVEMLVDAGIGGPYALALGPAGYTGVIETTEHGGILVFDHLSKILDGPIVRAPGVDGAVVLSVRGGDFLFESGQDLSIGYDGHDADTVQLYLEESFSFRVATNEAAIALVNAPAGA
jgi:uncharacterized linocin/CFP29 family protein